ncbi:unnamed protein product [marine sediment metagenome]|uniref:Uncharacterized protein n=1 Tax=marine sediment metagenome TaxID=412755 RepID=X0V865_9ZZZZ
MDYIDGAGIDEYEVDFDDVKLYAAAAMDPLSPPVTVTLTLAVNGEEDTMTIDVYDDACLAAEAVGTVVFDPTDVDENCITNFEDFAVMATTWLVDYTLTAPVTKY